MTKTVEYDLPVLLDGNVDDILSKTAEMPTNVLEQLLELEKGGKTRTTLMGPVQAELATRVAEGGKPDGLAGTAAGVSDDKLRALAEGDASAPNEALGQVDPSATGEKTFTQAEVDEIVAAKVAELGAAKPAATRVSKPKPAKPIEMATDGDAPGLVALTGGSSIVLVDSDSVPVAGLEPLQATPTAFEAAGDAVLYKQAIEPPIHIGRTEVTGAFLLDESGKAVGRADLVAPFPIGGGLETKLPPRTLHSARPAIIAKAAAA